MSIKLILKILILHFTFISISKSSELSPFNISFGASLSGNIYHSKFTTLTNYNQCSADYRFAFGLAPDFLFEAEYYNPRNLFGIKNSTALKISYSDISANYFVEEFIGHYIRDNDYLKTITEHRLKTKINAIILRPAISLHPFTKQLVSFQLGFHLGIPIDYNFSYEEKLKSPEDAFFIDGSKTRNSISAELPQFTNILYGLNFGASYYTFELDNWKIKSFIDFRLGLNNLVNSLNWKYINLTAGLALTYTFPKPLPPPPLNPPYPPLILPEPPKPKVLSIDLSLLQNDKKLQNADTVDMNFNVKKIIKKYKILPYIFYQNNQIEPEYLDDPNFNDIEKAQAKALETFLEIYRFKSLNDLTLITYITEDGNEQIAKARLDKLLNIFKNNAINAQKINTEIKKVNLNNLPNPLIKDEFNRIEIKVDGISSLEVYQQEEIITIDDIVFTILPKVETNYDNFEVNGIITYSVANLKIGEFTNKETNFVFRPSKFKELSNLNTINYLTFKLTTRANDFGNIINADTSLKIYLGKRINTDTQIINPVNLNGTTMEQFIIAYFEFDKSDFYYLDTTITNYVKESIARGKKIEIVPLTDNIGTVEYNLNLARSRALAIIKELQLQSNNYHIAIPQEQIFSNEYPFTRILNRSVIIRIPSD